MRLMNTFSVFVPKTNGGLWVEPCLKQHAHVPHFGTRTESQPASQELGPRQHGLTIKANHIS